MDSEVCQSMACCLPSSDPTLVNFQVSGDRVAQALGGGGEADLRVAAMGLQCPGQLPSNNLKVVKNISVQCYLSGGSAPMSLAGYCEVGFPSFSVLHSTW